MHRIYVACALLLYSYSGTSPNVVAGTPSAPLPGLGLARLDLAQAGWSIVSNGEEEKPPGHASSLSPVLPFAIATTNLCFSEINGDGATDFASADAQALRDALAAASPGGTVRVAGTCAGAVVEGGDTQVALVTKTITLIGGYTQTNWTDSLPITQPTTLDALGGGRVLSVSVAASVANLIIQNGRATSDGGGIYAAAALSLSHVRLSRNESLSGTGGGGFVRGTATITGSSFETNTAAWTGGGAFFYGSSNLSSNTFVGNTGYQGGGAAFYGSAMLTGDRFLNNTAYQGGGAMFLGETRVVSASFVGNLTLVGGAGAYFGAVATVHGSSFSGNTSSYGGGGGAFFATHSSVAEANNAQNGGGAWFGAPYIDTSYVTNTSFVGNVAQSDGGGAFFQGSASVVGGLVAGNVSSWVGGGARFGGRTYLSRTTIVSNTTLYDGGGARFDGAANAIEVYFVNNSAQTGGGASFGGQAEVLRSSFVGNTAQEGGGASFAGDYGSYHEMKLENNLFTRNAATMHGAAIFALDVAFLRLVHTTIGSSDFVSNQAIYVESGSVWLTNTLIISHAVGIERIGGMIHEDYTLFAGVAAPYSGTITGGGHSITGTAAFVDPAADDYHLSANSDAINAGANAGITTDFEGQPRPFGAGFDIGYDEWVGLPRGYLPVARR